MVKKIVISAFVYFFAFYILFSLHNDVSILFSSILLAVDTIVISESRMESKMERYVERIGETEKTEIPHYRRDTKKIAINFLLSLIAYVIILKIVLLIVGR